MADATVIRPDLSLVLERITDGFFAMDRNWRLTYINGRARQLSNAPEQCVGMTYFDAFPNAKGRLFEYEYARAMREQQPAQFVEYSATANCWLEVKAYPSPDGLSVYFRDISARIEAQRDAERNARRAQALLDFGRLALTGITFEQLLVDAIELLLSTLDLDIVDVCDFDRLNRSFRTIGSHGWADGSTIPIEQPPVRHLYQAVKTGEPFVCADLSVEHRIRSLQAFTESGVHGLITVLVGTPATPFGTLTAYTREARTFSLPDVRFLEAVAQTLAESASASESNRRMVQVLDSIKDAFVAVDRDLNVIYVNARMAHFWHVEGTDVVGMPVERFTDQFDDGGRALHFFRSSLHEQRATSYELQFRGRWYESRIYPFAGGVAAYVRDITRRKTEQQRILKINAELERRVEERTRQLQIANKELESFSYSVSHDLRAPLRAIDGFSAALVEDYAEVLDERAKDYLQRVRRAAQRMADLIDALLKLAKVARANLVRQHVDLTAAATTIVEELRSAEPQRKVDVQIANGLSLYGDPDLLGLVVQNLIGNAWKFTRKAPAAAIAVGAREDGTIVVSDNGSGFDMTYQNKLFGAFQRLHSADEYEGTGIGLATVARIVHRHGGTIGASGAVGEGASFWFSLPAEEQI